MLVGSGWETVAAQVQLRNPDDLFAPFADDPPGDPRQLLERLFGVPDQDERALLGKIDISRRDEQRLGDQAVEGFLAWLRQRDVRVVNRGRDVEYLREVANQLRRFMQQGDRYPSLRVLVAKSAVVDARSFPGGTIVVFEGLLDFLGNEAALAGVLGHELSHLDRGHLLVRAKRLKLAGQLATGGPPVANPFDDGISALRLWLRPFQPEDELQADRDGAEWAFRAGYDVREWAKVFARLEELQGREVDTLPSFFRSHPKRDERFQAIMRRYEELRRAAPQQELAIGAENLRLRVARSQRVFPE